MTAERYKLPKGWVKANFEQCIDIPEGPFVKVLRKNYLSQGKFPVIDQSSLFIAGYTDKKEELFKGKLPVIIFGDHTRIFKFVDFYFTIGADGTKILKAKKNIEPKYLFYYLKSIELPSRGYSRHYRYLRKNKILLAPKNEQKRIVEKIEILLDRLNKTKQELAKIPPLLKKFHQSVLAKAFTGELTEEWRGQQESLESASALLARIREERKKKLSKKYREPEPIDTSNLPELPEGWVYASLPCIAANEKNSIKRGPFGSAIKKAYFVSSGYKVYEQKNAIYNDFSLGNYYIDEKKFNELKDFEVRVGDLIISCSGTIGRIAVIPKNAEKGIINQALLKISLNKNVASTEYFINLFSSYIFQSEILSKTRGSAMLNISSVKAWKQILFPIPSLKEQEKIVEEIKKIFTRADGIEKAVQAVQAHCEKLNESILTKAFRGELVEQDPDDEPASMLLKKIKSEKSRRSLHETRQKTNI